MSATIVIPVYNARRHFAALVPELDMVLDGRPWLRVVLVDNASTDGVERDVDVFLARYAAQCVVVRNERNLGFTRAVNQGIKWSVGDVLLVNTDIRFTHERRDGGREFSFGWLACDREWLPLQLRPELEGEAVALPCPAEQIGIVAPRLRGPAGDLQSVGAYLTDACLGVPGCGIEEDWGQYGRVREVEHVTFACVLLTRACLDAVGMLDESLVLYNSDTEFCLRAARAGFRAVVDGRVTVEHFEGGSMKGRPTAEYEAAAARDRERFVALVGETSTSHVGRPWQRHTLHATVHGPVGLPGGYGELATNVALALDRCGVRVAVPPWHGRGVIERSQPGVMRLGDMLGRTPVPTAPTVALCVPDERSYVGSGRNAVATMLEPEPVPRAWAERCNQFDAVWTFTEWNRGTFADAGVTVPMQILPPVIDTDLYHPGIEPFPLPDAGKINLCAVFEWGQRKHPRWIAEACAALAGRTDVTLWVRTSGPQAERELAAVLDRVTDRRVPVKWLSHRIPQCRMAAILRAMDVFVSLGVEGIGLPALEALACGVPVIALDWGAGGEIVRRYAVKLVVASDVRVDAYQVSRCPHYRGATWPEPDWEDFGWQLPMLLGELDEAREVALVAAEMIAEELSYDVTGPVWRAALAALA